MQHWQASGGFKQFDTNSAPVDDLATLNALGTFYSLAQYSNVVDCAKLVKYVMAKKSKYSFKVVTDGILEDNKSKINDAYAL